MAQAKDVVAGVGARYAEIFVLDTVTGLPLPATASATPVQGTIVQGIKSFTYTDPEGQRFSHYGDDHGFAQDSLPATEIGDFVITTAKTNLVLDAMVEGSKVVTINSSLEARAVNTDKKGSEPQVMILVYRQALDVTKGSSTFGKLRQYHLALIPSTRITPASQSMEQGITDKTYHGIPTPVTATPWNQVFDESTWGATQGEYIEMTSTYKPRINLYRGDGTITAYNLSKPPVSSADLTVWVDGTVTAPSAVVTTTANPAFTMSSPPAVNKLVMAMIGHNQAD